jgi:hypothetical protein
MRTTNTRIAAAITVLAAGGLSGAALQSATTSHTSASAAATQPAVEVRTQVIRRTIHVVRHERPPRPLRTGQKAGGTGSTPGAGGIAASSAPPRTASSGSHASISPVTSGYTPAAATTPVRTRTSGTKSTGSGSSGSHSTPVSNPVRTRTSGAPASGGSGGPTTHPAGAVRTRTSGGGGHDDGGGHDN